MLVKIYLNDGEDHFFGFKNEFANSPELTMVHSFETTEAEDKLLGPKGILELVFQHSNTRRGSIGDAFNAKMLRSLSVGDVVSVGETAWAIESVGWKAITTEQLNNAIIWNDETERVEP